MTPLFPAGPADDEALRAALARGVPAFLLVNPIEYHGPHLSLRNDHLISLGLARDLHAQLRAGLPEGVDYPLLVTRDLDLGVLPTSGPGSEPSGYFEVRRAVLAACLELAGLGAKCVVIVTFHGAPLHACALEAGAAWLRQRGIRALSPMNLLLRELLAGGAPSLARYAEAYARVEPPPLRARMLAEIASDFHGGFFETSLALHYAPHSVQPFYREVPDCPAFGPPSGVADAIARLGRLGPRAAARAEELSLVLRGAAWMALRPFPGYTGAPSLASPEAGAVFARALAALFAPVVEGALHRGEPSPSPPLAWLRWATLFGRVGVHAAPEDMLGFERFSARGSEGTGAGDVTA